MLKLIVAAAVLAGAMSAAFPAVQPPRPEPPAATKRQSCVGACGVARSKCAQTKFTAHRACGASFNECRARCQTRNP
jgi:hypothetical protein